MKNFLSLENLELKSSLSIKSFISATSEVNSCSITNVLQEDKNIWLSEEFLPQEVTINFSNIKLKEHPKKLTAIGIYCWNKYPTNPKIIEVLISREKGGDFISLGHFDLSFKAGRQLIYLDDENDMELEEILNNVNFNDLIIKLIIKETFGGKHTYINCLYLYDNIDTSNINSNNNKNINNINIDNDIKDELNNIINDEYKYLDENNNNNSNDNINDNNENINDMNELETKEGNLNKIDDNKDINENQNQEILIFNKSNENELKHPDNINNNISQHFDDESISEYKYKTVTSKNNNKKIIPNKNREIKTPKIFKKYSYGEERPITTNSFGDRNINTTVRQYNNRNILDYSNNSNNLTNLNLKSSNALTQLINEFKNYKENQELMMNNYETRVQLLEEKCIELKNSMKKMNATMNTIIESQYNQSQSSNDYFLKECQNMVNEAIVNVLSNMGRNSDYSQQPMYINPPLTMKKIKKTNNFNNNMYINSYNSRTLFGRNSNPYNYGQNYLNKNNNINIMNNNFYEDDNIENILYGNDNDDNNMDNENDKGEEYMAEEIQNNLEEENYNNINNDFNNNYNIENNDENENDNENNVDYYKNENENLNNNDGNVNNNDNANILDNDDLNINLNINKLKEKNNNSNTTKNINSNELYNYGLIPYDEKIKSIPKNIPNNFARSTNNYHNTKNKIINQNNTTKNKIKSKSNKNIGIVMKKNNQNFIGETNNHETKKNLTNNNSKKTVKNNNNEDETNKELSSDFSSIDEIQINSKITENILKPTLEKFENLMSIKVNNNFGKSQNVYSSNSFNTKKKYFEESLDSKKLK